VILCKINLRNLVTMIVRGTAHVSRESACVIQDSRIQIVPFEHVLRTALGMVCASMELVGAKSSGQEKIVVSRLVPKIAIIMVTVRTECVIAKRVMLD